MNQDFEIFLDASQKKQMRGVDDIEELKAALPNVAVLPSFESDETKAEFGLN